MDVYDSGYTTSRKKYIPFITVTFLAVNILYFLVLEINGSTNDGYYMLEHGSLMPFLVTEGGQYYRLVTSFFMHFGFAHLFNNMLLLWYLGIRLERYLGHLKYAFAYMFCGVGANVASVVYYIYFLGEPFVNSAGASGAVFGIVGAMLWIALRNHGHLAGVTTRQLGLMILFTLYNGLTSIGVNNVAHISGLVIGFVLGMIFYHGGSFRQEESPDGLYQL